MHLHKSKEFQSATATMKSDVKQFKKTPTLSVLMKPIHVSGAEKKSTKTSPWTGEV